MSRTEERTQESATTLERYSLFDRVLHWFVALTFIYLMLSGLALGYPRMTWLYDVLGGGSTVESVHPWVGAGFTIGVILMLVLWAKSMRFTDVDRQWTRNLSSYTKKGHVDLDVDKYNAGQKGYFWFAIVTGIVLLLTGIPLWFPSLVTGGWAQVFRLLHHVFFLLSVGGFIIHVYTSTVMFPGTMTAMTTGSVSRGWAAWHHPRWFRDEEAKGA
jgi:formate dehydrogenase subunit gamma